MMKFVCLLTKKYEIPTDVSLNTIMVDGTGMCGACRITVGGKTKFVCVDGPEFDGHQVDFDEMLKRMGAFRDIERQEIHKLDPVDPNQCEATKALDDRNAPWREALRKSMKPKERTAIPRVKMNELDPEYRSHRRKEEVNLGLNEEQRGKPRSERRAGIDRSQTLLGLCQSVVYGRLPRRYQHSGLH